ncbi:MMPL family transporter, partial [Bacillus cereus]|uniref:MMPL family transporter n=1 Tax=Bacillus cereus TaxID=1396 RepID=UPI0018F52AE2|nr:MMPL family transporter [Bacillus cereus]
LAIILMIVVLFFVFPVRRRIISLGFVLIGLIWTFGFMGWAGIPITLATMATLPIIIGLGTDFGVQFHNRYEEEFKNSQFDAELAIRNAVRHIGPGVGIAVAVSYTHLTLPT